MTGESQRFQDLTGYDDLGRRVVETNKAGVVTGFGYDLLGRLRYVTNDFHAAAPNPFLTQYGYDEFGNITTQTDAENHTTTFLYNKLGQRIRRTLPANQFEQFAYDGAGNQVKRTNFIGKVTTFEYDSLNRLIYKRPDQSLGEPPVSFTYHLFGKRATMHDASGDSTYVYDAQHRLTHRDSPQGSIHYEYEVHGKIGQILGDINYQWNRLGQLVSVTKGSAVVSASYGYDLLGNLQTVSNANQVVTSYTYDENESAARCGDSKEQRERSSHAPGRLQLHARSCRQSIECDRTGRTVTCGYDNLYRLTSESIASDPHNLNGTINYTYDHVGNRLSRTHTTGISTELANKVPALAYTYDADDRLGSDSYDANGNTTASGGKPDQYDFEDHLISRNNGQIRFVYDGDGNRVKKIIGVEIRHYLIDDQNPTGYPQVVEEWIGNPASPDREYVYGLHLVAKNEASHWAYYGYDGHGSVRLLTDSNGSVTDTYTYDAFGILIDETHTGTPTPNDFLFAGEQFDPSLGMYNNRARYLNVATGRFWTGDTYEGDQSDPLSLHKYLYTHANPVNGIDPSGHGLLLDLLVSTAIRTTLYAATGVAIGAAVGAGDAYTRGEDLDGIFQAAKESGLLGLKVGALWQFKFVRPVIVVFGIGSGLGGTIDAIEKGNTANALYRGGFTLLGTVSIVQPRPSGGRLGSTKTRAQIERIAAILEKRGWEITGGGGRLPEEYLPPPGGGRKGGNYVDITAKKNGKVLRINTVDTLSDGVTPDAREAAAAALIRSKIAPGQHLLLIPKK